MIRYYQNDAGRLLGAIKIYGNWCKLEGQLDEEEELMPTAVTGKNEALDKVVEIIENIIGWKSNA